MNSLIKVNYDGDNPVVSGRDLHEYLEVREAYTEWFARMVGYGYVEGKDFIGIIRESTGGRPAADHSVTTRMAEHLCMIQRTDKGMQARDYFSAVNNAWNTPDMVMARALKMSDAKIKLLQADNERLQLDVQAMQPKVEYFDELVDRNLLTNFRQTAKEFGVGEREFIGWLLDKKYVYRDPKGRIMPYAGRASDLFEIKETINEKTRWAGTQTLITPKGRETFRLLYRNKTS
jgi:anti-repressor protein